MALHRIFGIEFSARRTDTTLLDTSDTKTGYEYGVKIANKDSNAAVDANRIIYQMSFQNESQRNAFSLHFEDHVITNDPVYVRFVQDVIAGFEETSIQNKECVNMLAQARIASNALAAYGVNCVPSCFDKSFVKNCPSNHLRRFPASNRIPLEMTVEELLKSDMIYIDPDFECAKGRQGYYLLNEGVGYIIASSQETHETAMYVMRHILKQCVDALEQVMDEQRQQQVKNRIWKELRHRAENDIGLPFPNFYLES